MRRLLGRLVLPLTCVLLGFGIHLFGGLGTEDPVDCGGRSLHVGEACAHMSKGAVRYESYEQTKSDRNRVHVIIQMVGFGVMGVGVLSGAWMLISLGLRAARRDEDEDDGVPARLQITAGARRL